MKYSQAEQGRIFVLRLEDGEIIHEKIEEFARLQSIRAAALVLVGGADEGSKLIVGPEEGRAEPITPMEFILKGVHEITGTGTIFPDSNNNPILHLHIACGRGETTKTGCARKGVKVWNIVEVILIELINRTATRVKDSITGFNLLEP